MSVIIQHFVNHNGPNGVIVAALVVRVSGADKDTALVKSIRNLTLAIIVPVRK